jgi:hypothetical protein
MPARRNCFYLCIGLMILMSSCTPRFFYPSRINYYSFDSCKQIKLIAEPYVIGVSGAIGYSPINHLALGADANFQTTLGTWELFNGPRGNSTGVQYDCFIGYYNKFSSVCGFDILGSFGHLNISGDTVNDVDPRNTISYPVNYEYYMFSVQPSFYINPDGIVPHVAFGCKASVVLSNLDKFQYQYNDILVKRYFQYDDILIEPGFEISGGRTEFITFGIYGHFSVNGNLNSVDLRNFTICLKLSPKFSLPKLKQLFK